MILFLSRLVALLVISGCNAFPQVSRLTDEEIHKQVEKKGWAKTRWKLGFDPKKASSFQGGQGGGVRPPEMSENDGPLQGWRPLLWSVFFSFVILNPLLAVTGDCGDDGCLCNIKISCKKPEDKKSKKQVCSLGM